MVSTRKLSSDEVNALIEGLNDGSEAPVDQSNSADVRPFKFGADELSLLGDYYALRLINERFARMARSVYLPMLRILPRISPFPPEVKTFDEYTANMENFMSLTISRIEELRGSVLLVLEPNFISILTNAYYGGKIESQNAGRSEFTATEERVVELVSDGLNEAMVTAWKDLMPIQLNLLNREINPQFASFVDGSEMVIVCSFVLQLPGLDAANFDIVYPLQTLKPIATQLRSRKHSEESDNSENWRQNLEDAVLDIPLQITAQLGQPAVPLSMLMRLQVGDVMPIQLNESVEVMMEQRPFFEGELGEVGGQSAINLKKRIA